MFIMFHIDFFFFFFFLLELRLFIGNCNASITYKVNEWVLASIVTQQRISGGEIH